MTYPRHFLGVFGGFIGQSPAQAVDQWQCTIRIAKTGTEQNNDPVAATYMTNEFKAAVEAFVADPAGPWSNWTRVTYLKVNEIGPDGRYSSATDTNLYEYPIDSLPPTNGSNPAIYDPAVALCLSWGTAFKRGRAHAGRMFVPCPRLVPDRATGRISSTDAASVAGSAATFIQNLAVGGAITNQWGPCVVSGLGGGAANEIQSVRVGNVLDVQQRRRNAMTEAYTVQSF